MCPCLLQAEVSPCSIYLCRLQCEVHPELVTQEHPSRMPFYLKRSAFTFRTPGPMVCAGPAGCDRPPGLCRHFFTRLSSSPLFDNCHKNNYRSIEIVLQVCETLEQSITGWGTGNARGEYASEASNIFFVFNVVMSYTMMLARFQQ